MLHAATADAFLRCTGRVYRIYGIETRPINEYVTCTHPLLIPAARRKGIMERHIISLLLFILIPVIRMNRSLIISRFIYTRTTSPSEAKQLKDIGLANLFLITFMKYRGVIKTGSNDTYYLDLDRNYEVENGRKKYLIGLAVVAAAAFIIVTLTVPH
jgi:hypothetical protein